jgi:hypothetical protein
MSKLSKITTITITTLIIISIVASTYLYLVKKDFYIIYHIECDPGQENCYIIEGDEYNEYYKVVFFSTDKNGHSCNIDAEGCLEEICESQNCIINNCDNPIYLYKFDSCSLE